MTDDTMVERIEAIVHAHHHNYDSDCGQDFGCSCGEVEDYSPPGAPTVGAHTATALLPLVRGAQAEALTAFIAEADNSPAITWTGMGGVKELATARAATYRTGDDHE